MVLLVLLAVVMGPFLLVGAPVEAWMASVMERVRHRPAVVFLVVAALLAGDVVLPVPSSIVSTVAGSALGAAGGTLASWIGMMISCALGFWLGRTGRPLGRRLVGEGEMARLEHLEQRVGDWAIVAARPLPVLAEASTILAGMGRMPPRRFALLTALANLAVAAVYAVIGSLSARMDAFLPAFGVSLLLAGAAFLIGRRRLRPSNDANQTRGRGVY